MQKEIDYYKVYFPKPDSKLYDTISQLMCLMAVIVFSKFILVSPYNNSVFSSYWVVIACIIGFLVLKFFQKRNGKQVSYSAGLFVCGIFFCVIAQGSALFITVSLFYIVAAVAERFVKSALEIEFDENEVVIKRIFKTHKPWNFISNIILKDGLLTIDYKNNKIFQKEIADEVSPELEKEFNEFCRLQLRSHGSSVAVN